MSVLHSRWSALPRGSRLALSLLLPALLLVAGGAVLLNRHAVHAAPAHPAAGGVPQPEHVVVVMEENHAYSQIIGSSAAPYINALAAQGALFTNSYAIQHPSQPNYLELFSGANQGVNDDSCPHTFSTANLGSELLDASLTFAGYSEDLPSAGSTVCISGVYARKHSPWVNFSTLPPATTNLPFVGYFPSDYSTLPTVAFVIPNLNNDMHDGTIQQGDTWLQQHLDGYKQWAMSHNSLLIVTWDEDDSAHGNRIATIFAGQMVVPGQYGEQINHYNVLRTLEDMYGLPYAGASSGVAPITDIWVGGATPTATQLVPPSATPACPSGFSIPANPNNGASLNYLYGVAARAATDVWAVGAYYNTPGSSLQTLAEHWTGGSWSLVPSANNGADNNVLWGVAAVASNDAWAVGSYRNANGVEQTLTEHWDGSGWSLVTSPNAGTGINLLYGVAARASGDVWAAGSAADANGVSRTLILHWDGTAWTVVASANNGTDTNTLQGLVAPASNDAWAVGSYTTGSAVDQTLVEHWNGSSWSLVASPNSGAGGNVLQSVTATAANDVWAAGFYANSTGAVQTLVERWNGSAWSIVASPNNGPNDNYLYGIAAIGPSDVWASGFYANAGQVSQALSLHYAVTCGTATPTVAPTSLPSATTTRTVGPTSTPILPSATRTMGPTNTPGGPTNTPAPTNTPGGSTSTPAPLPASATPCSVTFSDVHPTDYFYAPVQYLTCHGVISGYGDGTFRPYNQTTRAQMVKIVILGFGTPIQTPTSGYTFADVPPAAPFFSVIETAAASNIVSGYTCGGPNEPCDEQRRPYFRPNANVTRGQLSKINVLAAGWSPISPATASFADVAPGSAFYSFVETASCRAIISGYSCGGPGEPCDGQHRPYFRQNNPATRGQIAKIVYLSITSGATCVAPTTIR